MKQISTEKDGDWMAMAAAGRVRMDMCSSLVCLDANNGYRMEGRIYHNNFGGTREYAPKSVFDREGRVFRSFIELIEILDKLYDDMDYPQSNVELRTLAESEETINHKKTERKSSENGKLATFTIRVLFRQNASWQGTIKWMEQDKTENFRSVLELMHLVNSIKVIEEHDKTPMKDFDVHSERQVV